MTRPSCSTYLSSVLARLRATSALSLMALVLAPCVASCASAQAHGSATHASGGRTHALVGRAHRARTGSHGVRARARKAACASAHGRHGSHACSQAKDHRHKTKSDAHHPRRASPSRQDPTQGRAQTPPTSPPAGSPGTTCTNGLNATLDEEGTFACAGGGEPGCQEGFSPVVADDGSTLVCEPERVEAGDEEES